MTEMEVLFELAIRRALFGVHWITESYEAEIGHRKDVSVGDPSRSSFSSRMFFDIEFMVTESLTDWFPAPQETPLLDDRSASSAANQP